MDFRIVHQTLDKSTFVGKNRIFSLATDFFQILLLHIRGIDEMVFNLKKTSKGYCLNAGKGLCINLLIVD